MTSRRVLIVGAGSDLARATAAEFRGLGAVVAGVDMVAGADDSYQHVVTADCSVADEAARVVEDTIRSLGGVDTLVLAAATMPVASATDTTDEQWRSAVSSILDTAFFITRAALPSMGPGSSIIAVSSTNATLAAPGLPAYAAAKAGLEGLMRQLALEYGPRGIRANTVCPATISRDPDFDAEGYPLRRVARPEEVAKAIRFLGTDDSSFITGVTLLVDGGLSIASPAAWLRPDLREQWL